MAEQLKDWYPSSNQLIDPAKLEQAFREVLRLHYAQRDKVNDLHQKVNSPTVARLGSSPSLSTCPRTSAPSLMSDMGSAG